MSPSFSCRVHFVLFVLSCSSCCVCFVVFSCRILLVVFFLLYSSCCILVAVFLLSYALKGLTKVPFQKSQLRGKSTLKFQSQAGCAGLFKNRPLSSRTKKSPSNFGETHAFQHDFAPRHIISFLLCILLRPSSFSSCQ